MPEAKPYVISKQVVWEAYQKVKANHGAAGVDGQSIEAFETDLKDNLYKIWNRMSSGSYFPPPVRLVEIRVPPRLLQKYALRMPVSGPGRGPIRTVRTGSRCPTRSD